MPRTKKDLACSIADSLGVSHALGKKFYQAVLTSVVETIFSEGRLELRNFGVFELRTRKGRKGRNPRTGIPVDVPEKTTVTFKPGREMVRRCAGGEKILEATLEVAPETAADAVTDTPVAEETVLHEVSPAIEDSPPNLSSLPTDLAAFDGAPEEPQASPAEDVPAEDPPAPEEAPAKAPAEAPEEAPDEATDEAPEEVRTSPALEETQVEVRDEPTEEEPVDFPAVSDHPEGTPESSPEDKPSEESSSQPDHQVA